MGRGRTAVSTFMGGEWNSRERGSAGGVRGAVEWLIQGIGDGQVTVLSRPTVLHEGGTIGTVQDFCRDFEAPHGKGKDTIRLSLFGR